jgi:hypothetical protein
LEPLAGPLRPDFNRLSTATSDFRAALDRFESELRAAAEERPAPNEGDGGEGEPEGDPVASLSRIEARRKAVDEILAGIR